MDTPQRRALDQSQDEPAVTAVRLACGYKRGIEAHHLQSNCAALAFLLQWSPTKNQFAVNDGRRSTLTLPSWLTLDKAVVSSNVPVVRLCVGPDAYEDYVLDVLDVDNKQQPCARMVECKQGETVYALGGVVWRPKDVLLHKTVALDDEMACTVLGRSKTHYEVAIQSVCYREPTVLKVPIQGVLVAAVSGETECPR